MLPEDVHVLPLKSQDEVYRRMASGKQAIINLAPNVVRLVFPLEFDLYALFFL